MRLPVVWEETARRAAADVKADYYTSGLKRTLKNAKSLEAARLALYELLDGAPPLPDLCEQVLVASHLAGRYEEQQVAVFAAVTDDPFDLPPKEAIDMFRRAKVVSAEEYAAHADDYKARVFTLSRLSDRYALDHLHASLGRAITEGGTFADFLGDADKEVKRLGISSPGDHYWEIVFRNNVQRAYNFGRFQQQQAARKTRPWLKYVAVMDSRTRPSHRAFHNVIRPADDGFWKTHYPPNGHRCRCITQSVSAREMEREGGRVTPPDELPELWPDPGFKGSPHTALEAEAALKAAQKSVGKKGLLDSSSAGLSQRRDPERIKAVDSASGISLERQRELLNKHKRVKVSAGAPSPLEQGEIALEVSGFSQDADLDELVQKPMLEVPLISGSHFEAAYRAKAGLAADWKWNDPRVPVDEELLATTRTGKWTELALEVKSDHRSLEGMLTILNPTGDQMEGFHRPTGLGQGAVTPRDVMLRGAVENPPGTFAQAWLSRSQEPNGGPWLEVLGREPVPGWKAEKVWVNKALLEDL